MIISGLWFYGWLLFSLSCFAEFSIKSMIYYYYHDIDSIMIKSSLELHCPGSNTGSTINHSSKAKPSELLMFKQTAQELRMAFRLLSG